ncbi:MAG: thioredoxin-like domain-containing protein [Bdellovibrio sp.]|jgi:hypothetical protein
MQTSVATALALTTFLFLLSPVQAALFPPIEGLSLQTKSPLNVTPDPSKKAVVLVFLSVKCPCSRGHVPEIQKLSKQYPQFQFVGVHSNLDETLEQTQEYFKAQGLGFPVIQDDNTKTANAWKALKTPHVFVVSPDGNVLYKGGVSDSAKFENASQFYLREALEDLAHDRSVKTAQTRVLGCVIERGENTNVWKK